MSTVERWIHATVMRNVKRLDLDFCPNKTSEDMVMPHCLVTCASLEVSKLNLSNCGLRLPNNVTGFPALRVLRLGNIELNDDSVKNLLESCPLLEDLTLEDLRLDKIDLLCISWPKLKKLRIFESELYGCLKISCPELVLLAIKGYSYVANIVCERLYSCKEAIINVEPVDVKDTHRLFPGISHVEFLDTALYLLYQSFDACACDPALPNLKTLELSSTRASFTAKNLIEILKHCPPLESFCLSVENDSSYDSEGFDGDEYPKLDVAETRKMLTPDVKWVESFEVNGEKLKLSISRWKSRWSSMVATWGKKPKYSDWMKRSLD